MISAWQSAWAVGVCICHEIRVWMRVYIANRQPFLFHTSTITSKLLSVRFSGDSNDNFLYNPNKPESGCVDFSFRTGHKFPQNASESLPLKKIWRSTTSQLCAIHPPPRQHQTLELPPSQNSKILYETLHTHTPITLMAFVKLCHTCNHHAPLKSRFRQLPPPPPPPPPPCRD